jgi:5-methylcytosine-specific restriction endonuclease McrA
MNAPARRISPALRQRVAETARFRCGYCQTAQRVVGPLLEIDHIIPQARGGTDEELNLFLACPMCNSYKADQVEAVDPVDGVVVPLFNPRTEEWDAHFEWIEDGAVICGKTSTGRATVAARRLWVIAGWHPPED